MDSTKQTIRTTDKKNFHPKLMSKPNFFQKLWENGTSPNKHQLRGPGGKYVIASEKARRQEEGIILESESNIRKTESDKASDFECYDRSKFRPVHVGLDKDVTGSSRKEPRPAPLLNRSEGEENIKNVETPVGYGSGSVKLACGDVTEN